MRVTMMGCGYAGLVTGACLASVGHHVVCVDIDAEKVNDINRGKALFYEPGLQELISSGLSNGCLSATTDFMGPVQSSEVMMIVVGTPLVGDSLDFSQVSHVAEQIGGALRSSSGYHVVVTKSTVIPGTTDTIIREILEKVSGRQAGEFGLCVNPEFLREGSAVSDFMKPDRIVIGQWDERSGEVVAELYRSFCCPKIFTTLRNAELIKCASNALLANLISFGNEIAALCEQTPGTDIEEVLKGLSLDHRLSPGVLNYLRAGCGFGGSCLPKDVEALRSYAREKNVIPHLLDAVVAVNEERPLQILALLEKVVGPLNELTVAILGLSFKPQTDDLRNSPSLVMIDHLFSKGALVKAYDPVALSKGGSGVDSRVTLCETPEALLTNADCALLVTAWEEFAKWDWVRLHRMMRRPILIDGRNALRHVSWPKGMRYIPIGKNPKTEPLPLPVDLDHEPR